MLEGANRIEDCECKCHEEGGLETVCETCRIFHGISLRDWKNKFNIPVKQ
jgi:hypothetical protein